MRSNPDRRLGTSGSATTSAFASRANFEANLNKLIEGLELASEAGLDVVSFPESFLTGYFRKEEEARANSFSIDSPQMREVLSRTACFQSGVHGGIQ